MIPGGVNELLLRSAAAGGATAGRSVRFNSADSAYLSRTPASAGNRRTSTLSFWTKKVTIGGGDRFIFSTSGDDVIRFNSDNKLRFYLAGTGAADLESTQLFRDPSAWYHFVFAFDTTQGTASDRIKVYLNGVQITAWGTATYPSQNYDMSIGNSVAHYFGRDSANANHYNGYLALVHYVNGQALTPSSFGETSATTGQWVAKTYSGSYGTNGFFLDFSDNSAATATTLGKDSSGLGNNWTPNNLSVTAGSGNDSLRDHPTSAGTSTGLGGEVAGNYATWNPLSSRNTTLTNGNLDASIASAVSNDYFADGTFAVTSGKWYWEYTYNSGNQAIYLGAVRGNNPTNLAYYDNGVHYYGGNGRSYTDSGSGVIYGATYTTGDVIGVALDITNSQITFYKNGSSQGILTLPSSTSGWKCSAANGSSSTAQGVTLNAGQRAFAYTAPSGFSPLVDTLLPTPTIAKPNTVMDAVAYTGTGSSNTITLPGSFNPDFIWIKRRSAASDHILMDVVRGFGSGATPVLFSNLASSEAGGTSIITSTSSTGFTIGGAGIETNANGSTYVAWAFDAGSSNATNTSGSITSTVRANISAGFSVITWTGTKANASVGHSLGIAPEFILFKTRGNPYNWRVYHASLGNTKALILNSTATPATSSTYFNNTSPTSTVINLGSSDETNDTSMVAYAWTPVAGYSAFGSYTGSASQPFVYLGFRPKFVWIKFASGGASTTYTSWYMTDSVRDTTNPQSDSYPLWANASYAEGKRGNGTSAGSFLEIDFLSNGFRVLDTTSEPELNYTGATYIYCAWAEAPFPYARAR